ncbi:hypothetical protein D9615_008956 [Tricholomella constricta]|uniref:Uncharacterized protein n=1 Tax=Tricholomella constricta TaxID=117010 RepID=A0A8H5H094_9AGAR|nr:hypothetical protein D9615_008956 [Tricholomella constricta]
MLSTLAAAQSCQTVTLPEIPELYDPNFLDVLIPARESSTRQSEPEPTLVAETPRNSMMEALKRTTHKTLTQNLAPTYDSTLSPTLDAFQSLASAFTAVEFNKYLEDAWAEDPDLTLRIIWNIRSIHDGKGDKELFYKAFGWLYNCHPRTAISNLRWLVEPVCTTPKSNQGLAHGYWKDLLNIIALAAVDELHFIAHPSSFLHGYRQMYHNHWYHARKGGKSRDPAACIAASLAKDAESQEVARKTRAVVGAQRYDNLVKKLAQPKFRALYIAVARLFSDRLAKDLRILDELDALSPDADRVPLLKQISLAGKWAPTPMGAHDRHTNIATAISLLLRHAQAPSRYPSALDQPLEPIEAAIILRSFYQRWVLTRLRSVSAVPEPLMSANRWVEIKYNRVPSVCMKNNLEYFYQHDPSRFQEYLTSVEKGRKKISGATLFPHELVARAVALGAPVEADENHEFKSLKEFKRSLKTMQIRVVEAQWKTLIERLRESGSINNALAICDVSGSMGDLDYAARNCKKLKNIEPILPAISLSLVLAHLAKAPFTGGFITFSERPEFVQLDLTKPLHQMIETMSTSHWSMNTDLHAVFLKLLLPLAVKNKVPQEEMIKRLFIFSDMQFDECSGSSRDAATWATNHDVIERAYKEAGYEMPQIVYWDLAQFGTVEVQGDREGVALLNGLSPALLKVFMGESEEEWEEVGMDGEVEKEVFNPVAIMQKAVMRKSFDGLVVVD